jgi:hypothetical protein
MLGEHLPLQVTVYGFIVRRPRPPHCRRIDAQLLKIVSMKWCGGGDDMSKPSYVEQHYRRSFFYLQEGAYCRAWLRSELTIKPNFFVMRLWKTKCLSFL